MRPNFRSGQLLDRSRQIRTAPGQLRTAPDSSRTAPYSSKQLQTGPGQLQTARGQLQTAPGQLRTCHWGSSQLLGRSKQLWTAPVPLALQIQCIQAMHLSSASAHGMYFMSVMGGCGDFGPWAFGSPFLGCGYQLLGLLGFLAWFLRSFVGLLCKS